MLLLHACRGWPAWGLPAVDAGASAGAGAAAPGIGRVALNHTVGVGIRR